MSTIKYPVYNTELSGNEKKYVNECLDTGWLSWQGHFVRDFENAFAEYLGVKYATSASSGTTALHLALLALGIGEGDEVIVPTFTYVASVNSISYTRAKPAFCDSLEDTVQINPNDVLRKITPRTKAIMAVHTYGHPCEMQKLQKIARDNNLFLIENCAESVGSTYNGQYTGTFGDISIFSFFANKTITTGEGGMVVTNSPEFISLVIRYKGQGLEYPREYWHDIIGYNYRLTNISAAIGLAQLERIDSILQKKHHIAGWYRENLQDMPIRFFDATGDVKTNYWMITVFTDEQIRDKLRGHLRENDIETRPAFNPVHLMPMYENNVNETFPVAEKIGRTGINLPSYASLTRQDVDVICNCIREFFSTN